MRPYAACVALFLWSTTISSCTCTTISPTFPAAAAAKNRSLRQDLVAPALASPPAAPSAVATEAPAASSPTATVPAPAASSPAAPVVADADTPSAAAPVSEAPAAAVEGGPSDAPAAAPASSSDAPAAALTEAPASSSDAPAAALTEAPAAAAPAPAVGEPMTIPPVQSPALPVPVSAPVAVADPLSEPPLGVETTQAPAAPKKNDGTLPDAYKNDLFHCLQAMLDGATFDDDSVACDPETFRWDLAKLDPEKPPDRCKDYVPTQQDVLDQNDDDWTEPCLWWHMNFGDLKKSQAPSGAPSTINTEPSSSIGPSFNPSSIPSATVYPTAVPTVAKSASPTVLPSSLPSLSPSLDIYKQPSGVLSDFVLILTLPIQGPQRRRTLREEHFKMTRELLRISESHFQTYMESALGLSILKVELNSGLQEYTDANLLVQAEGAVYFHPNSVVPTTDTLDVLIEQAVQGKALDQYLRLLRGSDSPTLKSVLYAEITEPAKKESWTAVFDQFEWTTPWIVIIAGGGIGLLAILLLLYLLCVARSRRNQRYQDNLVSLKPAGSDDTPITAMIHDAETGKDGIMKVRTIDEMNDNDVSSDGTSIYSYKQNDDATSVSLAPSFLHAITERSALGAYYDTDDDSIQAPSLQWNQPGTAGIPEPDESVTSEQAALNGNKSSRRPQSIRFYPTGEIVTPRHSNCPGSPQKFQDASWIGSSLAGDDDDVQTDVASTVTDAVQDVSMDVALMDYSVVDGTTESFLDEEDVDVVDVDDTIDGNEADDYTAQENSVDDYTQTENDIDYTQEDDDADYAQTEDEAYPDTHSNGVKEGDEEEASTQQQQRQQHDDEDATTQTTTDDQQQDDNVFKRLWNDYDSDGSKNPDETDLEEGAANPRNETVDLSVNLDFDSCSIADTSEIV